MQIYHAELKKFEDTNFGSGEEISLFVDKDTSASTANDKNTEPGVLEPMVRLIGSLRQRTQTFSKVKYRFKSLLITIIDTILFYFILEIHRRIRKYFKWFTTRSWF